MTTEQEIAEAVEEWVKEVLPELAVTYPYVTAAKANLPDAAIVVERKAITLGEGDQRFPWGQLQQRLLRVFDIKVSLMVEKGDGDTADREGTEQLRDFGARLEASLIADATLADRVQMASSICEFDYALPFVRYADGTRGREMNLSMAVAELADEED